MSAVPWNTRQLADLVGTTVNTVRHYHRRGLLDEPTRRLDGQRRYEVRHLVRLLQVRRLAHLGVPLHDIAEMGADAPPSTMLRLLETELTQSISSLRAVREDLATLIRLDAPYDVPAEFGDVADHLSTADRALALLCSRLISASELERIRDRFAAPRTAAHAEFDALPSFVDDATVRRLSEALPRHPVLAYLEDPLAGVDEPRLGAERTRGILLDAVAGLHNAAQIEVLRRIHPVLDTRIG